MKHNNLKSIAILVLLSCSTAALAQYSRMGSNAGSSYLSSFQRMEAGSERTFEIRNGKLYGYGGNSMGELGNGSIQNVLSPTQVNNDSNWVIIASGHSHTMAIKSDGTLWAWGNNANGRCGLGSLTSTNVPIQVGTDNDWVSVSAGAIHTMAIKADGTLWAFGSNNTGMFGSGNTTSSTTPVQVGTDNNWKRVQCGVQFTLALKYDGTVWATGENTEGQLGNGNNTNSLVFVQCPITEVVSIAASYKSSYAITADGALYAWGDNADGRLGDGTTTDRNSPVQIGSANNWVQVSAGERHTLAVQANGTLWSWGYNQYGELGIGSLTDQSSPVQVGNDSMWVAVAAGTYHSAALKANGQLYTFGSNVFGALGDGSLAASNSSPYNVAGPTLSWVTINSGYEYNIALKDDGSIWGWGGAGAFGDGNLTNAPVPFQIGTERNWVVISTGWGHSLAIKANGTLWATGNNNYGALGVGDNTNRLSWTQVGGNNNWTQISAGEEGSMALSSNGALWTWGNNSFGTLGNGNSSDLNTATANPSTARWINIAMGNFHCLAIQANGTLWSWGRNTFGQVGDGTSGVNRNMPLQLGNTTSWAEISCSQAHSHALQGNGALWGWGNSLNGEVGNNLTGIELLPVQVGASEHWLHVTNGYDHSGAINAQGSVFMWGNGANGQLGDGSAATFAVPLLIGTLTPAVFIEVGSYHSSVINGQRNRICQTGRNSGYQMGDNTTVIRLAFLCDHNTCVAPQLLAISASDTLICPGSTVTLTVDSGILNQGTQWTWYSGSCAGTVVGNGTTLNVTPQASTTYFVRGEGGCASAGNCMQVTVNIISVSIDTAITQNSVTLTSAQFGATYQWIDCSTNQPISGATSQSYAATANGNYAVIVTMNTCSETSSCYAVTDVGVSETTAPSFTLAPNPANDNITIIAGTKISKIRITDVLGNVVTENQSNTNTAQIDISMLSGGMYLVEIQTAEGIATKKLIKK
ncbi:MAG: hypothetical protein RL007_243 [Bacteroidota bacterium]